MIIIWTPEFNYLVYLLSCEKYLISYTHVAEILRCLLTHNILHIACMPGQNLHHEPEREYLLPDQWDLSESWEVCNMSHILMNMPVWLSCVWPMHMYQCYMILIRVLHSYRQYLTTTMLNWCSVDKKYTVLHADATSWYFLRHVWIKKNLVTSSCNETQDDR